MNRQLVDALEVCMQEMDSGTELESCLGLYPELRSQLRPILEAHYYARMIAVPGPSRSASEKSRTQMLARAHEAHREPEGRLVRLPRIAEAILALFVIFVFAGGGIWAASAGAVPGDALYSLKLSLEDASLKLAPSQSLKSALEETYKERRVEEAQDLLTLGREEEIVFEGEVTAMDLDSIVIEDMTISLTDDTEIFAPFREGDGVEITAIIRDGVLIEAYKVRLRSYWMDDVVVSMTDEYWEIGDTRLRIDEDSIIDEGLSLGDRVTVIVEVDEDGLDYAQSILRATETAPESTETPTPPSNPEVSATPTPEGRERQIYGAVREMGNDFWRVGRNTVLITTETEIEEGITTGDFVLVDAILLWDGSLIARKIESGDFVTKEPGAGIHTPVVTPDATSESTGTPDGGEDEIVHFTGILQSKFQLQWRIGGQFVRVNDSTEIIGEPEVGDLLDVIAVKRRFGTLIAKRIEVVGE